MATLHIEHAITDQAHALTKRPPGAVTAWIDAGAHR